MSDRKLWVAASRVLVIVTVTLVVVLTAVSAYGHL